MVRLISKLNIIVHLCEFMGYHDCDSSRKQYKKRHLKKVIHFNVDFVKSPGYRHAGHLSYYK